MLPVAQDLPSIATARKRRTRSRTPAGPVPKAVILAGGRGTRLAPYTSVLPKPLMPIGGRAILELLVDQLEASAVTDITFCVGHLGHLIRAVFDHRTQGSASIRYVHEDVALGTAAPLRFVSGLDDTFLVMNGDILTNLDCADLVRAHRAAGNALTVATHARTIEIDYGVIHVDGADAEPRIVGYEEKPQVPLTVSMGIYVLEPCALQHIPEGRHFDFPELVQAALAAGLRVGAHAFDGLWFDIGRKEDYEIAVSSWVEPTPAGLPSIVPKAGTQLL